MAFLFWSRKRLRRNSSSWFCTVGGKKLSARNTDRNDYSVLDVASQCLDDICTRVKLLGKTDTRAKLLAIRAISRW
jgi:hypothetical protein